MLYFMIVLCAVFFTVSVFLIAKFAIKKKDDAEFVESETYITKE